MESTGSKPAAKKPNQAAAVIMRRAKRKLPHFAADEEINLVPYLDVVVNLCIFLLVTITAFLPLGMLSIFPMSTSARRAQTQSAQQAKKESGLSMFVTAKGFTFATATEVMPRIPKLPNGEYDFDALAKKALELKTVFPEETRIVLSAEKEVKYDIIIKVMDTLREQQGKLLFYNVQLSAGIMAS